LKPYYDVFGSCVDFVEMAVVVLQQSVHIMQLDVGDKSLYFIEKDFLSHLKIDGNQSCAVFSLLGSFGILCLYHIYDILYLIRQKSGHCGLR
jgi:hypothetical protein